MEHRADARGFTLIELSLVLVIIGLIIGSVLVGRDQIRQAELRAVVSQIGQYNAAANTFRIKFNCLPGDCTNPTAFLSGTNPLYPGDGDGLVLCNAAVGCYQEQFQFWYQLALAGLIAGQYTGSHGGSGDTCAIALQFAGVNANVPTTRSDSNGAVAITVGYTFGNKNLSGFWFLDNDQVWLIGAPTADMPNLPIYRPNEAWQIDQKLDDGLPGTGNVRVNPYTLTNCTTSTAAVGALYDTTYNGQSCSIVVRTQF